MSFGFSIGDFITVGKLIQDIVSSLRASSKSEYRELILELHGLQRALHEIEHLKCHPSQEPALSGIKVAALMCQYPLDEFAGKLKQFESLGPGKAEHASRLDKVKMWGTKLKWGFCMEEEVMKVRAYLMAHVGSLNMRLITQGLTSASLTAERSQKGYESLETVVEKSHEQMVGMRRDLQANESHARSNSSILTRLSVFITGDVISQLKTLVDLTGKVWQSNMRIMAMIANLTGSSTTSLELRYTWVQEPIRFEDAMGRVIPIPSEYNWEKLEAIIIAQFKNGPGYRKICAGDYELFNTLDSSQIISPTENEVLTPGLSVTMAIIVGKYHLGHSNRCPRPGCKSERFIIDQPGRKICLVCRAYFDLARKTLPLPLRPPNYFSNSNPYSHRTRGLKRKSFNILANEGADAQERYKKTRLERKVFKNFRMHLIPLAQSPTVSNVRRTGAHCSRQNRVKKRVSIKRINNKQLTPGDSTSNRKASYPSRSARATPSSSRAATVVSEPYWSLAKSESGSICTTRTDSRVQEGSSRNLEAARALLVLSCS